MAATHQIKQATNGTFFFRLVASNGEIILASQIYVSKTTEQRR